MAPVAANKMPFRIIGAAAAVVLGITLLTFLFANSDKLGTFDDDAYKPPEKVFNAQSYQLDNGLDVIVIPNHRAPVVTHMLWYKVGAADETPGKSGAAHFLEHMMFKGSKGLAPGEFSETVRRLGGNDNAFTSQDFTAYFQSVAVEHLETVMRMEAGRMRGLAPPNEEFLSEKKVVQEERRQRVDNNPESQFMEEMRAHTFLNHPYGTPVLGWDNEVEALTWDDLQAFYNRWYGPNNAVLVVTGDVTGPKVLELARSIYGSIPMIDLPEGKRTDTWTQTPNFQSKLQLTFESERIAQPALDIVYRVPSISQNQDEAIALQIAKELLGGSTGRLYQALVVKQKLATNISLSYISAARDDGQIWIMAYPANGVSFTDLQTAIDTELAKFASMPLEKAELKRAVQRMQDAAVFARDSLSGPAMIIGREITSGASLDYVEYWPKLLADVERNEITSAVAKYLTADIARRVVGYMKPAHIETSDTDNEPEADL